MALPTHQLCVKTAMRVAAIVVCLASLICLPGCSSHSTQPRPAQAVVYVGAEHGIETPATYRIYVLSADSLTLLDSLIVDRLPFNMLASPDGKWLYFGVVLSLGVFEVRKTNALTGDIAWSIPLYRHMSLLDHGQVLAFGREIRNAATGELMRTAPDTLILADGDPAGTKLAAVVATGLSFDAWDSVIVRYDVRTGEVSGRYVPKVGGNPPVWLYRVRLHADGNLVGVIGIRFALQDAWFVLGDLNTGETLLTHQLRYPFGDIAFSGDGRMAAVTDPGDLFYDNTVNTLDLFDLESLTHIKRFAKVQGEYDLNHVSQTHFTDCDGHLITLPAVNGNGRINIIDLNTLSIEVTTGLPGSEAIPVAPLFGGSAVGWRSVE